MNHGSGIGLFEAVPPADLELDNKQKAAARASAAFSASLLDASAAGKVAVEHAASVVRPLLIGVGVLSGVLLTVQLLRNSGRTHHFRMPATSPPRGPWSELARFAVIALASAAGRGFVRHWLNGKVQPLAQRS